MGANAHPDLSEYAARLIKYKAKQLVGRFGFTRSDGADIEQDLSLMLLQQMRHFDRKRGNERTFVSRIVNCKVVSIIRHRAALRRNFYRVRSIDDAAGGVEHSVAAAFVVEESPPDRAIDLTATIQSLDPDLQNVCSLIMTGSVAEAARRLGLTRGKARGRLATLRKRFTDAGLKAYLKA